jgi:class 3 adenylate cyclase
VQPGLAEEGVIVTRFAIFRTQVTTVASRLYRCLLRAASLTESPRDVTLVAFDIVGFGRRGPADQIRLRRGLFAVVKGVQQRLGHLIAHDVLDRGDGVLVLLPGGTDLIRVVEQAIPGLAEEVTAGTGDLGAGEMRLRCVIHKGEVQRDKWGWVGHEVNLVFRLIDADELRRRLSVADASLVVALSQPVYGELARLYGDDERDTENSIKASWGNEPQECRLAAKETNVAAWVAPVQGTR